MNAIGEGAAGTSNDAMPAMASPENGMFYSGVIDGPDFCTNYSLGGAHLIAHDSDGDGVADVCSLPYTRREAIARQNAVEALAVQNADAFAAAGERRPATWLKAKTTAVAPCWPILRQCR